MFYILKCFSPPDGHIARVEYKKDSPFRLWNRGQRFANALPTPVVARVVTDSQTVLPELWETPLPMMTQKLHEALLRLGVANLDVYPVALTDTASGAQIGGYVAFNLIGVIAAADAAKTVHAPGSTDRMIAADIDHLEVDPAHVGGAHMFRLAESVSAIVVREAIRGGLLAAGFTSLTFLRPEEWAG